YRKSSALGGRGGLYALSFFFFSSRRRHTRFSRDWSSDVCSSDLVALREVNGNPWTTAAEIAVDVAPLAAPSTITAQAAPRCLGSKAYVAVTARNTGTAPEDVTLRTPFGERTVTGVAPGASAYQSFATRAKAVDAGTAEVESSAGTVHAEFAALSCR